MLTLVRTNREGKKNPSQKVQPKLPGFQASGVCRVQLDTEGARQRAEEDHNSGALISTVQSAELTAVNIPLLGTDEREDALGSSGQSAGIPYVLMCFHQ